MESENKQYKWTYLQNRNRLTDLKNELMANQEGEGCGKEMVRKFGIDMYTLLYFKWITNKNLLYSTWNSAQCYVARMGREFRGEWINEYVVWLSPSAVQLKLSQRC